MVLQAQTQWKRSGDVRVNLGMRSWYVLVWHIRSIQVATVRRYVCNRKAVSDVNDIDASVGIEVGNTGDWGTVRFKELKTSLGGDSSET